ncbi:crotonase/enoyl-CoA hydratase family protein [Saccharopolyspora sp. ASAGF58]|uniref:crotonase/enoyl-CoA hydratase family protein n=1 Tax=Saccharopolyspora sp. ASAGF58 TaxID=2719023 RepID=UPI0014402008|nr:crotonase/enoyl-CoA hydratase family protein [Saccharopolyspora sp. ASAGF58]QIZ37693.1 crotonase/enoyl-CoA hydratase family protein [Saccharopolyspora sp. ASAGF58]
MTDARPVHISTAAEGVLLVAIDRPHARNAINDEVARLVAEAMDRLDTDDTLRAGILTGNGSGFSAGLDLKAFLDGETGEHPERGFAGLVRRPPRKPLIAAIEGFALAGGLEVALACDLIVAARDARLGIPEVSRGLVADGGALLRLPQRLPRNIAAQLALIGDELPVPRLHELGLVNVVTEPGESLATAEDLATAIAANAPLGVVASKYVLDHAGSWPADEIWQRQARAVEHVWASRDATEGARAFAERRPPRFTGR